MRNIRYTANLEEVMPKPKIDGDELIQNMIKKLPSTIKAAMLSGCEMDLSIEDNKMIVRTKNPISILRNEDGQIIDVYEKKNG